MVVHPAADNTNNRMNNGRRVARGEVLPEKFFHAFELCREAVSTTGKSQCPVTTARNTPVAGKPQKFERRQTAFCIMCSHCRDMTCRNNRRFFRVHFKAELYEPFWQNVIEAFGFVHAFKRKNHVIGIPHQFRTPSDMRLTY